MANTVAARRSPEPGGISSVDNALLLLQLVGERQVLRVADAATELGVARSTAHRLLSALRHRGFVTQDRPNGAYRPGRALTEVGLAAIGRIDIRRIARPVLEHLSATTEETSSLLLLEGIEVRFVDCVESPRSVRVGSRTGVVLPAHCTAGGKAILAALPPAELRRRYAEDTLARRTAKSIADWPRLERELVRVRRNGVALNLGESEVGVSAVGAAVHDVLGAPLAGLAVAVPASRLRTAADGRGIAAALVEACAVIAEQVRAEL